MTALVHIPGQEMRTSSDDNKLSGCRCRVHRQLSFLLIYGESYGSNGENTFSSFDPLAKTFSLPTNEAGEANVGCGNRFA